MFAKLSDWYNEKNTSPMPNKEDFYLKGSAVEICFFYFGVLTTVIFCLVIWLSDKFHWKFLLLLLPVLFWVFLRSSRKDMNATGNWIAGFSGMVGGIIIPILAKTLINK